MTTQKLKILLAENGTVVALIALVIVFAILNPRFLQLGNIETIVLSMAEVGLVAIALAFLVMTGSIDLSVGAVASLGAVTSALVSTNTGNVGLGLAAGLGVGIVTGTINGLLVEFLHLNSLVVTLGFLNVWGGLALFITNGRTVTGLPESSRALSNWSLLAVVPLPMLLLIIAMVTAWLVLNYSPFGRRTLAVGGNSRAAFLMGINVRRVRMGLFVLVGAVSALAGVLLSYKLQSASPTVGSGLEFTALTVVLLGGVAVSGGQGKISGVIAGLLFVGVLRNGLVILGVSQFLQTMVIGLTLVLAISLDQTLQRVMRSAWSSIARRTRPGPANSAPVGAEPYATPADDDTRSNVPVSAR